MWGGDEEKFKNLSFLNLCMGDKYLEKLNEDSSKIKKSQLRGGYRQGGMNTRGSQKKHIKGDVYEWIPRGTVEAEKILNNPDYPSDSRSVGYAMAVAKKLMDKERSLPSVLDGARIYEKIGQGSRASVKSRLLKRYLTILEESPKALSMEGDVKRFLEENSGSEGGLEKTMGFFGLAFLAFSLILFSVSFTGHAILVSSSKDVGMIGVSSFFLALVFGFIYLRMRNSCMSHRHMS